MKKIIILIALIQGVLVSATIEEVTVKGVKVPLIFEKDDTLPIASMELIFKNSGSIKDGKKLGVCAFTSSILNEGTKKLGSVGFATKLEESAIHLGAGRGIETFSLELSSLKEKFKDGVFFMAQLLSDPNFSKESFEKIKLLKIAAIKKKFSDFDYTASIGLKKLRYEGTPMENPSIGTLESLEKLKLEDMEEFFKEHLVLSRLSLVIGGDLSLDEAKKMATEVLSVLEVGKSEELKTFQPTSEVKRSDIFKDTKQAYVYFGAPYNLKVNDTDVYKATVATFILGAGGFGSRMMEEIRVKRGLAYSAYCTISINKSRSGLSGHLQTKLESGEEAIKIVKEVFANFVKKGVSADELEQAKKFIIGSEPLRNEKLSQRLHRAHDENYKGFKLGHTKEQLQLIENLKLKDLNSFIKKHDEINKLSFCVVTKQDDIKK